MRRNEIYLVDFDSFGCEQSGLRPALIVQNDVGNFHSPTTIVCPLTSKTKSLSKTHLELSPNDCGIVKNSFVLCEQIRVVDKMRIKKKVGELTNRKKIEDLNKKIMLSVGIIS